MAHSLLQALAPDHQIDVLTPPHCTSLLQRMPEVSAAIAAPFQHGRLQLKKRWQLGRELAARRYHQAIVLPNSWKSALVPYWAGISRRTGYLGEQRWGLINDVRRLNATAPVGTAQRFVDLAYDKARAHSPLPQPKLESTSSSRATTRRELELAATDDRVLVLCPGAEFGPAKRWPGAYFASVAQIKMQEGWQVWLVGSRNDADVAADINQRCRDRCVNLTGRTNLAQVVDVLTVADCVVSNDSGLMHIAAAVGSPLVAIFGSTDPRHTPPLSPSCEIVYLELACSPCFERQCPLGHLNCLKQLAPDRILAAIDQLLDRLS